MLLGSPAFHLDKEVQLQTPQCDLDEELALAELRQQERQQRQQRDRERAERERQAEDELLAMMLALTEVQAETQNIIEEPIVDIEEIQHRSLLEALRARLPVAEWSQDAQSAECALCLGEYCPGDRVTRLGCFHAFHSHCLDPWLNRASVLFGRPSFRKPKPAEPEPSCLDGCFARFLGYPSGNTKTAAVTYSERKALTSLPAPREWAELPAEKRGGIQVEVCSHAKELKGWINQDAALAVLPAGCSATADSGPLFLLGVFDGHGRLGHEASETAARRMPGHLSSQQTHPSQNPAKALEDAFRSTDDDIYAKMGADVEYSGSTGVVVLLDRGQNLLTVANVGDSRAVLGRLVGSTWQAMPLTTDLKPEMPEERERIELSGGVVCQYRDTAGEEAGPFRVWDGPCCEKPGLAVSRSLGDGAARALGVIAAPVVTKHKLQGQDKFLIIATDGLWDSVDNEEAVRIVAKFQSMPSIALKALTEAVRRAEGDELVDDTTILLVHFRE
ncbi:unnamed protein product [Symbiodinium pilosum]|uniref:PPM-type phosphatase domain-containing protein n=1 Tax=Symbiodinium pilosum TaxID=2952 RepID=A0A812LMI4_SYMPI|nr:unnamed protein product [Symbiodinium pilosum]